MHSSMILMTLIPLLTPIIITLIKPYKIFLYPHYVKLAIIYALIISILSTTMYVFTGQEHMISNWHWTTIQTIKLSISFKLDFFSMIFTPVALFVTWSIVEFSMWYMSSDPNINKFLKYLLIFLVTMLILVTANNLFQLFIGWEGIGIMSFLLISWWYGRADANTAALQAILYNRIGDIGLILAMTWFLLYSNSWELQQMFMLDPAPNSLPLMGLLLAATGKSAQFGLHPWLPSAMEGPTPVSALLHSSTMVVAGIFLIIRLHPLFEKNLSVQTLMLSVGAITTLFTAICALTQNDMKKIVAFSTSSQLGLMMVTVGINQPHLAFLHICTHAFFKAMLFLASGSIIHSLNNEQDIRKMGGLFKTMPFTSSSIIIGSLALMGMPFLTGFYSKDLIIETANTSYTNAWALMITLVATSLTAMYSIRIIFFTLTEHPRFNNLILINENNPLLMKPINRLAMGSIFAGFLISNCTPPMTHPQVTMPQYLKLTALGITTLGLLIAMELSLMTNNMKLNMPVKTYYFSNMLGFYSTTTHRSNPHSSLAMSQNITSILLDMFWLEKSMPKMTATTQTSISTTTSAQKGLIKLYFLSFLIPPAFALLLTI
uniref:NADH-ubiquinone oxidoreductase chain 5 n=1 Tax=Chiropotes israelita TaxID=280163 RepID=A0A075BHS7_9PRIM|nr:NADH dehydrogenase subunit 5 [Chiropotes israelita]AGK43613.1 NADH dehydrogenase subunit 5 [Chiropotes israelita]URH13789.1 NADH dehydrogenase subunit 5 [Chiropotes israelita]URH14244.1 NADH dehydrogenase subunit 5 [Chiropotes israelita]URH14270.1 NADH dehydrogenase subunit 5 [Chiropotes israelita]